MSRGVLWLEEEAQIVLLNSLLYQYCQRLCRAQAGNRRDLQKTGELRNTAVILGPHVGLSITEDWFATHR